MMADPEERSHPCPACGFRVHAAGPGSGRTCPLCGWVDDGVQLAQPDFTVGANVGLSLREAQQKALARYPRTVTERDGYAREPRWRPLLPGEGPRTSAFGPSSPVCYLDSDSLEESEPYWLAGLSPDRDA
jgi:hypothetical protein